jgi:hypothetical protein
MLRKVKELLIQSFRMWVSLLKKRSEKIFHCVKGIAQTLSSLWPKE